MQDANRLPRPFSMFRSLLRTEAGGGLLLIAAAALALIIANSPLAPSYFAILERKVAGLTVLHWINDALMALFFLIIGLEIKRELLDGQLSSWSRRILPGIAAAGGMIVPALIFVAFNWSDSVNLRGWAIPTATDIAFALGVLALIGRRVPVSLKLFLTALAIIDDLGAVAIIALLYTPGVEIQWLAFAGLVLVALWTANKRGITSLPVYLALGAVLWWLVLKSGVHATLAGVALAFTIPLRRSPGRPDDAISPLHRLEHGLHPLVAFAIVPLFGFANAGVDLGAISLSGGSAGIPLGIAAGLFVGKQVGVFAFSWGAIRLGLADCPRDASLTQLYGISLLCGIGFTMSLFIGLLAFPAAPDLQNGVKLGVLVGSLLSAILGVIILRFARPEARPVAETATG